MLKCFESFVDNNNLIDFLSDKKFRNSRTKSFLYHGTYMSPKNFKLRNDYEWEDSNEWGHEMPEGYLFLSTDIEEAKCYGQYIMPCELKRHDSKTFEIEANNPSQVFDNDYNGRNIFWPKFEDSRKSVLIIKGYRKSTVITYIDNIIPRTDLAIEYYKL